MVVFDVAYLFQLRLLHLFLWLRLRRLICCCSVADKWRPEPWSWAELLRHLPVSLRMRSSRAMLKRYPTPSGLVGNTALVL